MAAIRVLRHKLQAELEENEDYRLLRGLEFVLAQEGLRGHRHAPDRTAVQPGVGPGQNGNTASASPDGVPHEDSSLDFSQIAKAS